MVIDEIKYLTLRVPAKSQEAHSSCFHPKPSLHPQKFLEEAWAWFVYWIPETIDSRSDEAFLPFFLFFLRIQSLCFNGTRTYVTITFSSRNGSNNTSVTTQCPFRYFVPLWKHGQRALPVHRIESVVNELRKMGYTEQLGICLASS